ncbi:hypothetical protein Tco_0005637 [Tanacetum coccineum]
MSALSLLIHTNMVAVLAKPMKVMGLANYFGLLQVEMLLEKVICPTHAEIFVTPSHTKKVFGNMKRVRKGFSGAVTPLFLTIMVQAQEEMGEEQKPRKPKRKDTEIPQSSGPTEPIANKTSNEENVPTHFNDPLLNGEDRLKLEELMTLCTNLQNMVLDLEHTKTTQALEIESLKRRVNKLEKKQRSKTPKLKRLFKVGRSAQVVSSEDESWKFTVCCNNYLLKEITLALSIAELGSAKLRRGPLVNLQQRKTLPNISNIKDKGKAKMIEPEKPLKIKEQIRLDEELAFKLQAEEEEQARLAREKAENSMTKVNMFVDMDTKLVKESSKKAEAEDGKKVLSSKREGDELEQEL